MAYTRLCPEGEIAEGSARAFTVDDLVIAVFHLEDGFYAIDDTCTHDDDSLSCGPVQDGVVQCPWHGARFDIRTGRVLRLPAVEPVSTYPVRVQAGWIEVDTE